jgi:hypothetical protein
VALAQVIYNLGDKLKLLLTPHAWLLPTGVAFFFIVFAAMSVCILYWPRLLGLELKAEQVRGADGV